MPPLPPQRTVSFVGAPFCEGQNLQGAELAPTALREAGVEKASALLGWGFIDEGDIDFAAHFEATGLTDGACSHHVTVQIYREWLKEGMRENFSTWVHRRYGEAALVRTPSTSASLDQADQAKPAAEAEKDCAVVNVELMGAGIKLVYDACATAAARGNFVLTVGGDHSIAAGSISAMHTQYPDLGVIWVDAHADANTPRTSPSGHYHGMPAAHLMGWFEGELKGFEWFKPCLDESRLAYVGLRDIDPGEAALLKQSNVHVYTMRDVDKYGIANVIEKAISAIDPNGRRPFHLSLDIDGVDPHFAPGTGTCARGGLTYREIHYVCEELALTERLVGMDLVEVNPSLDLAPENDGKKMHGDNPDINPSSPTVQLGVELVLSALGKKIM